MKFVLFCLIVFQLVHFVGVKYRIIIVNLHTYWRVRYVFMCLLIVREKAQNMYIIDTCHRELLCSTTKC